MRRVLLKPSEPVRHVSLARLSFFYLAGYLSATGAAFLLVPQQALALLQAQQHYDPPFVRFVGAFMAALATIVVQIIRHHLSVLYSTTVGIRLFFLAVIAWLYLECRDPLFLSIFAVVALGVLLTAAGLVLDRRAQRESA